MPKDHADLTFTDGVDARIGHDQPRPIVRSNSHCEPNHIVIDMSHRDGPSHIAKMQPQLEGVTALACRALLSHPDSLLLML